MNAKSGLQQCDEVSTGFSFHAVKDIVVFGEADEDCL